VDVQLRLAELDLPAADPAGSYGPATHDAVAEFQGRRGLERSGVVDARTWAALVEAGYRLGDRLLYRRREMSRGDDVADLQRQLSTLGFDPGRIDGIFGDETMAALREFQRNAGLPVDGICGPAVLATLHRLRVREGGSDLVTPVRERLRVAAGGSRNLSARRVAVGEYGGFATGVSSLCHELRGLGATALELHDPDPSRQAAAANRADVDCFVSLRIVPELSTCTVAYYRGFAYESATSKHLAGLIQARLPRRLGLEDGGTLGIALPILRETRMPAVEIQLGSPAMVVQKVNEVARIVSEALATWIAGSFD